jgi:teichuronic acid biosynthesis glycosyltransferase TuaC
MVKALTKSVEEGRSVEIGSQAKIAKSPHLLTLTPFYPSKYDDTRGCFIAESLAALQGAGIRNTVIGVQPFYRGEVLASERVVPALWRRFFTFPGNLGLPSAGRFLFSSLLSKVRALHRSQPLDLIHAHAALPCGHAAALLARELRVPYVVTAHGLDVFFDNQVAGYAGAWCRRVATRVYQGSARTICISERVREILLKGASVDAEVVYNGVDTEMFSPAAKIGATASILCVGNLIPIKGQDTVLRAFAEICGNFPQLECRFIGEGPERQRLDALARTLGIGRRVSFDGRTSRSEVARAMAQCALFALPSRYEGLGCVYLEAMASGKPAIACRGQGIEEIIQHGRNGWLVEPGNVPELADALVTLMRNPDLRARIGTEARRTVIEQFSLTHQAANLKRIYCEHMA